MSRFWMTIAEGFTGFFDFASRSKRDAFWLWLLFVVVADILASALGALFIWNGFAVVIFVILLVPTVAFMARRLRDGGVPLARFWLPAAAILLGFTGPLITYVGIVAASLASGASTTKCNTQDAIALKCSGFNASTLFGLGTTFTILLGIVFAILALAALAWFAFSLSKPSVDSAKRTPSHAADHSGSMDDIFPKEWPHTHAVDPGEADDFVPDEASPTGPTGLS